LTRTVRPQPLANASTSTTNASIVSVSVNGNVAALGTFFDPRQDRDEQLGEEPEHGII
jgi:hypothetical protein